MSTQVFPTPPAGSGGGGGGGTPASTVVTETSFGQASAVGSSTNYARGDHTHGTPAAPSHPSLSTLGWSASGHIGTQSSVAAFNATGAAQTVQATVEGSVLTYVGGVLQFSVVAAAIAVGGSQDKTLDVEYIPRNNTVLPAGDDAAVGPGSFI
jgi:hypothetical protein